MTVKLLWSFGCTGSSESTHVKMPHCWKSHVTAHMRKSFHGSTWILQSIICFTCFVFFFQNTRMKYLILLAILFAKGHGQQLGLIPPGRPVDRIPGPVGPEPIIDPQPPKSEPPRPA